MDKRSLLGCVVSFALLMASFTVVEARNLREIKDAGTLVIATNPNYPPQSYVGKDGKLEGFDVDVGQELAKRLGVAVSFVTPQWDLMTSGNWGGRWDVSIASMAPTEKRSTVLDFPAVYYYEQAVAAVNQTSPFASVKDLSGKTIGVTGGTLYEDYLNKKLILKFAGNIDFRADFDYLIDDAKVVAYEDEAVSMDDLKLGDGVRLNSMLASKVSVQTAIAKGYPFRMLDQVIFAMPQAIAVEKGNAELAEAVAKAISDMHADGTLSKLSLQWHKADLTNPN